MRRRRDGVLTVLVVLVAGGTIACLVAALVDGLGPWVLAVVALLAAGVARLKWREVRARRAERRTGEAVHDLYTDALDRAGHGDHAGAATRFADALRRGGGDLTADLQQGLAAAHLALGETGRAVTVWREAYQLNQREQGDDALPTIAAANGLAAALLTHGDRAAAAARYRDTLERCRRLLGDADPETVAALNGVTRTDPTPRHDEVAALYEDLFGPSHPDARIARRQSAPQDPATARLATGDLRAARTLYEQAVPGDGTATGTPYGRDATTPAALNDLAMVLREQRDLMGAHRAYERATELSDPLDPDHLAALAGLTRIMLLQGDETNATAALTDLAEACATRHGPDHPETAAARRNLARLARPA
ncbi:tetratricopeptide repeat protein [Dactylosporangium sp. NPDC049742]|uniref:tetratricopeptide repeat protein n=1 Tax=Dactylosporangium sp. NPDC049742 TaxID=3154737 RepID=UPI0034197E3C